MKHFGKRRDAYYLKDRNCENQDSQRQIGSPATNRRVYCLFMQLPSERY